LHPKEPSVEVKKVVHLYDPRVLYLVGSAVNEADLKRAAISKAVACYVMASKGINKMEQVDQACSLITTALRDSNPNVPIFAQVYRSQSVSHCLLSGASSVICIEKLKLSTLAMNCEVVGLSTLLSNLLDTVTPNVAHAGKPNTWEPDYLHGESIEIIIANAQFQKCYYIRLCT